MHKIDKTKLSDQTKFRLYEIKKIENYFINEINQQKSYSKKLSKYVTACDYIDNILIIFSATTDGVSILSFTSIIVVTIRIANASFTLIFSLSTGIIKKLLNITRKKNKKYDQILMLAESKFNSIETLISQASNDIDISQEEFITVFKEKHRYERMEYNLINENENEKQENIKLSSILSKNINVIKESFIFLYI